MTAKELTAELADRNTKIEDLTVSEALQTVKIKELEETLVQKLKEIEAIRKQAEETGANLGKNLFELMNKIEKLEDQNDILIHVLGKTAR